MEPILTSRGILATSMAWPENRELTFTRDGDVKNALELLYDAYFNCAMFDVYNHPSDGKSDRSSLGGVAWPLMRARLMLSLTLHFGSAPDDREKTAAWADACPDRLKQAIFNYAHISVASVGMKRAVPRFVQLGADMSHGFVYPNARIGGEYDTPEQWARFTDLLAAAIKGAKLAAPGAKIIIPFADIRDADGAESFFARLIGAGVAFDAIGLSYRFPDDGDFDGAKALISRLAAKFGKKLLLTSVEYPRCDAQKQADFITQLDDMSSCNGEFKLFDGYFIKEPFQKDSECALVSPDGDALAALSPRERPADNWGR